MTTITIAVIFILLIVLTVTAHLWGYRRGVRRVYRNQAKLLSSHQHRVATQVQDKKVANTASMIRERIALRHVGDKR